MGFIIKRDLHSLSRQAGRAAAILSERYASS